MWTLCGRQHICITKKLFEALWYYSQRPSYQSSRAHGFHLTLSNGGIGRRFIINHTIKGGYKSAEKTAFTYLDELFPLETPTTDELALGHGTIAFEQSALDDGFSECMGSHGTGL